MVLIVKIVSKKSLGVKLMFDISNELSTTQDGLVFLLVRFLFTSSSLVNK